MSSLPDITYKQLLALLKHYGCSLRGEGSPVIVGRTRSGATFTVHHHPGQKVWKAKLAKILKYAEITQEEFWNWYHSRG